MKEVLIKLLENSYTPYYKYPVSAAVVTKSGEIIYGVNIETSSPASGICAERNALYQAITKGYKKEDIKEIHIMNNTTKLCYPCFICRQALNDLCEKNTEIISHTIDGKEAKVKLEELCPYPFENDNMKG